jgi:hypothetical protein
MPSPIHHIEDTSHSARYAVLMQMNTYIDQYTTLPRILPCDGTITYMRYGDWRGREKARIKPPLMKK